MWSGAISSSWFSAAKKDITNQSHDARVASECSRNTEMDRVNYLGIYAGSVGYKDGGSNMLFLL